MHDWIHDILRIAFTGLASIAAGAVTTWLVRMAQKAGLAVTDAQQARLEALVIQAILAAEEWAVAQCKAKLGTPTAGEKLDHALATLETEGVTPTEALPVIHAQLTHLGLGAADDEPGKAGFHA